MKDNFKRTGKWTGIPSVARIEMRHFFVAGSLPEGSGDRSGQLDQIESMAWNCIGQITHHRTIVRRTTSCSWYNSVVPNRRDQPDQLAAAATGLVVAANTSNGRLGQAQRAVFQSQ